MEDGKIMHYEDNIYVTTKPLHIDIHFSLQLQKMKILSSNHSLIKHRKFK